MTRIEKIKLLLNERSLDAFYITHLPNIRYLTNFSGSAGAILITKNSDYFLTDFRYKNQSAKEVNGFEIFINYNNSDELKKLIDRHSFKNIAFEANHMIFKTIESTKNTFPDVNFIPLNEEIEHLTVQKTPDEISRLRKAIEFTDKTFSKMLEYIKPGISEKDVAAEIT